MTLDVSDEAKNVPEGYERIFSILRVHEGETTKLASTGKTSIPFASDQFSTYVVAYQDIKKEVEPVKPDPVPVPEPKKSETAQKHYTLPLTGIE